MSGDRPCCLLMLAAIVNPVSLAMSRLRTPHQERACGFSKPKNFFAWPKVVSIIRRARFIVASHSGAFRRILLFLVLPLGRKQVVAAEFGEEALAEPVQAPFVL